MLRPSRPVHHYHVTLAHGGKQLGERRATTAPTQLMLLQNAVAVHMSEVFNLRSQTLVDGKDEDVAE
jgi:hypothetical protein